MITQIRTKTAADYAGEWISHAMELANMSQSGLSEKTGIARTTISRVLSGKKNIRVATLFALIEGCGFEVMELKVKPRAKAA